MTTGAPAGNRGGSGSVAVGGADVDFITYQNS
jgi:hypothetical protein